MARCLPLLRSCLTISILAAFLLTLGASAVVAVNDNLTRGATNKHIFEGLLVSVLEPGGTLERREPLNAPAPDPTFDASTSAHRSSPLQESDLRVASLVLDRTESRSPRALEHAHVWLYIGKFSHKFPSEDTP